MCHDPRSRAGCFTPPTADELAALPRCATCGGIYPVECPPHVQAAQGVYCPACQSTGTPHTPASLECRMVQDDRDLSRSDDE